MRLDAAYQKTMAKKPAERFASMSELIDELDRCRWSDAAATELRTDLKTFRETALEHAAVPPETERETHTPADRALPASFELDLGSSLDELVRDERSEPPVAPAADIPATPSPLRSLGGGSGWLARSRVLATATGAIALVAVSCAAIVLFLSTGTPPRGSRAADGTSPAALPKDPVSSGTPTLEQAATGDSPSFSEAPGAAEQGRRAEATETPSARIAETVVAVARVPESVPDRSQGKPSSPGKKADNFNPAHELLVGAGRTADYNAIATALHNARPGARIRVEPGVYHQREVLRIERPVEIVGLGAPGSVVVEAEENVADCFLIRTSGVTIRNMAITSRNRHAIKNTASGTLIEDCDLVGPHNVVYTGEANTMLTLRRCKLHGSVNNGAWIHGAAVIEDCEFFGNRWEGVIVSDTANFVMRGGKVHDNGRAGVRFHDQSKGSVEGCTIFGNRLSGVQIDATGHGSVFQCQIHRNSAFGITVKEQGEAVAERNDLSGNKNGAFEVARNARMKGKNNRLR